MSILLISQITFTERGCISRSLCYNDNIVYFASKGEYSMGFRKGRYEIDMTSGPLLKQILLFTLPLIASSVLQLMFNAADVIVVGRFEGEAALAAVGSTGALTNLIVNLFIGLSVGTNVVVARYIGAGDNKNASESVHTSITISVLGGAVLAVFGYLMAGTFLQWMGSPDDVRPLATLYMKIFFLGMPFNMLYNFGSAVLRAVGDTQRPLIYLTIAGVVNVLLNLLLVIVFHLGVAGVAIATITSQAISSILVLTCLLRSDGVIHVDPRKLRVKPDKVVEIAKIGLPAGVQGMCFNIANVLIQSTINSFGSIVIAGNSAASNIEGFVYVAMNAIHQAAVTFTSQNIGARKYVRVRRVCFTTVGTVTVVGIVLCSLVALLQKPLLGIYSDNAEVIRMGGFRLSIVCATYFTCGIMDVLCGVLRGMGSTILPMIVTLMGACALRVLWVMFVLPLNHTLWMLYLVYPVSWVMTSAVHALCVSHVLKRFPVSASVDAHASIKA